MEIFNEIWSTLRQNKLRTVLTGFAVSWGLFMLIALLGAGNGLLNALKNNSMDVMVNSMKVYSGYRSIPYEGTKKWSRVRMTEKDLDFVGGDRFETVIDEVAGQMSYSDTLAFGPETSPVWVYGVEPVMKDIDNRKIMAGRYINQLDIEQNRKVIVIDNKLAESLSGELKDYKVLVGKYVKMSSLAFQVVGVYEADDFVGGDSFVYLPLSTVSKMRTEGHYLDQIAFSFHGLETQAKNEEFESEFRRAFNFSHRAAPQDQNTVYIWNRFTQNLTMNKAVNIMKIALWILGIFTLLSGIVGVSNIMLITVKERIHEFGIRKALGATPWGIMRLIITESVLITAFFGYLGMVLGMLANYIMDITIANNPIDIGMVKVYMFKDPTVGFDVAIEATILIIIAGTLAGLIPAYKASRVRPIEALRNE